MLYPREAHLEPAPGGTAGFQDDLVPIGEFAARPTGRRKRLSEPDRGRTGCGTLSRDDSGAHRAARRRDRGARRRRVHSAFAVLRYTAPARFVGPPPHRHAVTTEAFHVLDGALTVTLDRDELCLEPGATTVVDPGRIHAFRNDGVRACSFLVVAAPPGLEQFLRELADLMAESIIWPPEEKSVLRDLGRRYDQLAP